MKYYLGIDGGGTRTTAAVSDENGKILLKTAGGTINFYSVGMQKARHNLAEIINKIHSELGVVSFAAAFIGCSALDNEADEKLTSELCADVIKAEKIKLHSDVYIALRAVGTDKCPCVAICGTGSIALCEDSDGKTYVSGGWGHIIGDEGSAYAIATEALKICCIMSDKEEKSALLESANAFFGVENFRQAIDIIYSPETAKDKIAGFAGEVGRLAVEGDIVSVQIISRQAFAFAQTVAVLLRKNSCCTVLGLYGGVFQHNEMFTEYFKERIKAEFAHLEIKLITTPPEESALVCAREL